MESSVTLGGYQFVWSDPARPWFTWHTTVEQDSPAWLMAKDWTHDEWVENMERHDRAQEKGKKRAEEMFWKWVNKR